MSYLVDARALRPRHEEREQDFMCTSTLYNVFSKHLLEKKHEPLSSGDELWVPDVENCKTNGPMMSKLGSIPVPGRFFTNMNMRHYFHGKNENSITCILVLPNGNLLCSDDQHVSIFDKDATRMLEDCDSHEFHAIVELPKLYEGTGIRKVSVAQDIKHSIKLERCSKLELPARIQDIAENSSVKAGDLIYKVRGRSVLGMHLRQVYTLINQDSFGRTFELEISDPIVCVATPKIKSLFVYPNNAVVFVNGNKLSVLNFSHPKGLIVIPLAGHDNGGYVNGKGEDARFNNPRGVIVNQNNGDVIVADSGNHAIRLIKSDGTVTTLAGAPPREQPGRRAVEVRELGEVALDDGLTPQRPQNPEHRALFNNFMSKVHSSQLAFRRELAATAALRRAGLHESVGMESPPPVAAGLVALQSARKRNSHGFFDETGSLARFNTPTYLAWDNHDCIVVVDAGNHSVRRVTMQGVVSTVAGGGVQCGISPGKRGAFDGRGTEALFDNPGSVVVDADGTIVVVDTNNNRLCKIVGDTVTTVAHDNLKRFRDGHSALNVALFAPIEMTLQRNGTILIEPRPGLEKWHVVGLNLKEPAWFKMYREGVRLRWLVASCLRLGRLKHADQSSSSLARSEETMNNILRRAVAEPSFLDGNSKNLNTVQAFGARIQGESVGRALLPQPQLVVLENDAEIETQLRPVKGRKSAKSRSVRSPEGGERAERPRRG
jgi:hypothetical protein